MLYVDSMAFSSMPLLSKHIIKEVSMDPLPKQPAHNSDQKYIEKKAINMSKQVSFWITAKL